MSDAPAPAFCKKPSIFLKVAMAWPYESWPPSIVPSALIAVVPDTNIWFPTRTTRENPYAGSKADSEDTFCRICLIMMPPRLSRTVARFASRHQESTTAAPSSKPCPTLAPPTRMTTDAREEARRFAALWDVVRCARPDILRGGASERPSACGRFDVGGRQGHDRNIRSAGLRTPAGSRVEDMRADHDGADIAVVEDELVDRAPEDESVDRAPHAPILSGSFETHR
jgi:hypothetical protein